jgi:hypothetical protein
MKRATINSDPVLSVHLNEDHIDHLDDVSDERNISRAALIRKWMAAGERAEAAVIPNFDESEVSKSEIQDPVEQLFRDELSDSADEAISVDEMRERLKERVDSRVMTLYRELDDIETTEGGEMYANE